MGIDLLKTDNTMKKKNSGIKDRKRLARIKREMEQIEAKAYKEDGISEHEERFNSRYNNLAKEAKKLTK
jgi:hypothetical protein